jgi:hypothetical protein
VLNGYVLDHLNQLLDVVHMIEAVGFACGEGVVWD